MYHHRLIAIGVLALLSLPAAATAFPDADIVAGEKHHQKYCIACHEQKYGGKDGSDIYIRVDRKVNSPSALSQQITSCTTMLNLDLFPEDEMNIAGYLNKHYYKFK
ncbi:cytochrome c [Azoarcus sp. L1K30]|uniref:cytochrome c n=1 Tax=Azoarcus sp. L1K30 TaxID=2820277 RepID=UPI001B83B6C1|nr:cytochrome c [Azoarcus sp. L1K30]MBR0564612.1 cytochrome c [Azoarcus sp. L1K30]